MRHGATNRASNSGAFVPCLATPNDVIEFYDKGGEPSGFGCGRSMLCPRNRMFKGDIFRGPVNPDSR